MDELIAKIEETVRKLISYDMEGYASCAQELSDMMMAVFPVIISSYADPRMSNVAEDAKYWPGQLERVLKAFEDGDDFATADILYNETRVNLIELRGILTEKGII